MDTKIILLISIILQLGAALLALRLIRVTGRRISWALIAFAILLMAVRRSITFYRVMAGDMALPPDFLAEIVALLISILMVVGIAWISPFFLSIKKSRELIEKSEEKYRTLFEDSKDSIFISSLEGSIIDFNKAAEEMLGYSREELLSMSMNDLYVRRKDRLQFRKIIESQGYVKDYELQLRKKDGSVIDCLDSATIRRDMERNIIGYQGIIRNITKQKRANDILKLSEEKFHGIFDESIAAIYLFDAQKNFMDSNQAGLDLLGYSKEELLKMSIHQVDADPEAVLPEHQELLTGNRIINFEHKLKKKNGSIITVLNNSRPIHDEKGNVSGMQSTLIDITQRKQAEVRENVHKHRIIALNEASRTLVGTLKFQDVANKCAAIARELVDVDGASIFLLNNERTHLSPIVSKGPYSDEVMSMTLKLGEGIGNSGNIRTPFR